MSKIFSLYTKSKNGNDVDRVWYQSSNIKYSECDDKDNSLKTLRVVFNNGTQYEYKDVNVNQYLLFRDAPSQGKALNEYIKSKGYEYEKLENADLATLDGELTFRMEDGIFVFYEDGKLTIKDNKDKIICEREVKLTSDAFDAVCAALEAVGKQLYTEGKDFENNF
ncbi:MAG: KTSC domain-containing protein [Bacilli bacterium]|nr:KTSC domain-containing protein [Bacilli bacterium]